MGGSRLLCALPAMPTLSVWISIPLHFSLCPPTGPLRTQTAPPPWLELKLAKPVSSVLRAEAKHDELGLSIWQSPGSWGWDGEVGDPEPSRGVAGRKACLCLPAT